jgi:hypothetical protein
VTDNEAHEWGTRLTPAGVGSSRLAPSTGTSTDGKGAEAETTEPSDDKPKDDKGERRRQPKRPPKPKRTQPRLWPWLLLVSIIFLIGVGVFTSLTISRARGPIDATNQFIARLDNGELREAYDLLCAQTRVDISFSEFQSDMARSTEIADYTMTSISGAFRNPALIAGSIKIDDTPRNVGFRLRQENGQWRVCEYDRLN